MFKVVGPTDKAQLDQAVSALTDRIDSLGLRDVHVRPAPGGRIIVTTHRPIAPPSRRVLTKPGSLAFYDLEADLAPVSRDGSGSLVASTDVVRLAKKALSRAPARSFVLFGRRGALLAGPESTRDRLLSDAHALGGVPQGAHVVGVPAHETIVSCAASTTIGCPGSQSPSGTYFYVFKDYPARVSHPIPEATGSDLTPSAISAHAGTQPAEGAAFVELGFTSEGNRKFRDLTRAEAQRGQQLANAAGEGGANDVATVVRFAQHFAIVLDDQLQSTPYIDYKQDPDGIDPAGVGAVISNMQSLAEARDLAIELRSGALPFHLVVAR
jgi:preprotein translocase subunit SecD